MTKRYLMLLTGGIGLCLAVLVGPSSQAGATARDIIAVQHTVKTIERGFQNTSSRTINTRVANASMVSAQIQLSPQMATILAASDPSGTFMDCGIVTCTVYFSWNRTVWLNDLFNGPMKPSKQIAASLAGGALCAFISGPAGALCAGAVLLRYSTIADHLEHSIKSAKCSAWQFNRPAVLPLGPPAPIITITGLKSWSKYSGRTCK
ncbi:hypothetical protein IPM44_01810 [bacterium]|nr:MAG: hypothetical protein IPM44_01810 [bacterium]